MVITTDISLKGKEWADLIDNLSGIFKTRTNYSLFLLCLSIGINYDKRYQDSKLTENGENPRSVPRNVIQNNDRGRLDFMFQAAILNTTTESLSEEKRLELAFDEKDKPTIEFDKIRFLTEFANYGAVVLLKQIGITDIETMDNIMQFLDSPIEGTNYVLPDEYSDDELADAEID